MITAESYLAANLNIPEYMCIGFPAQSLIAIG